MVVNVLSSKIIQIFYNLVFSLFYFDEFLYMKRRLLWINNRLSSFQVSYIYFQRMYKGTCVQISFIIRRRLCFLSNLSDIF